MMDNIETDFPEHTPRPSHAPIALEGIRVINFSHFIAGPFATAFDHPLLTDAALRPFQEAATDLAGGSRIVGVLRHLPGRRVTTLLERETDGQRTVLKVFASPRARDP